MALINDTEFNKHVLIFFESDLRHDVLPHLDLDWRVNVVKLDWGWFTVRPTGDQWQFRYDRIKFRRQFENMAKGVANAARVLEFQGILVFTINDRPGHANERGRERDRDW